MVEYHLHKWSVIADSDPFRAPELQQKRLAGFRCEDDREVITSVIKSVDGKRITTQSGSIYVLEDIDPDFLSWMKENDIPFDPEKPITIREIK